MQALNTLLAGISSNFKGMTGSRALLVMQSRSLMFGHKVRSLDPGA